MKYPVKRYFVSREGNHYREGDIFETGDLTRAKKLQGKNWIGAAIGGEKPKPTPEQPKQDEIPPEKAENTPENALGQGENAPENGGDDGEVVIVEQKPGGWYKLSDGRTVRKSELPEHLQQ